MVMSKKCIRIKYVLACCLIVFCFSAIFNQAIHYAAEGDPISSEIFLDTVSPDDLAPEVEMGDNFVTLISKQADIPDENEISSGIQRIEYGYRMTGSTGEFTWQSSPEIYGLTLGQSYDFVTRAYDYAQNMTVSNITAVAVRKNTRPQFKVEKVINISTYNSIAIKEADRIQIRIKVVSSELASTSLNVDDIIVRVGETVVTPATKRLSSPIVVSDGAMWDLTLSGITDNGTLFLEVPEGVAISNFDEINKISTLDTGATVDNVKPSNCSVVINDGASQVASKSVKLTLIANGADSVFINNTGLTPSDNDEGWVEFLETKYHELLGNTGENIVYVWFKDLAGNVIGPVTDTIEITQIEETIQATIFYDDQVPDTTAPSVSTSNSITKIICNQKDIYKDSVKSGVNRIEYGYRVNGTEEFTWISSNETDAINETNLYDFVTRVYDAAGNVAISDVTTISIYENTTPVISLDKVLNISTYNPSYIKATDRIQIVFRAKTVAFKSSALTADDVLVKVGGEVVEPTLKTLNDPIETADGVKWTLTLSGVPGNGVLTITIPENKVIDNNFEGNIETNLNTTSLVDNQAPTNYSVVINNGVENTSSNNVSLLINATGADYMYISNTNAAPAEKNEGWGEYVRDAYHTLIGENGANHVYVWFKDLAGNIAGYATDSINVSSSSAEVIQASIFLDDAKPDTTAPSVSSINRSVKIISNQRDINKDGVKSGIATVRYGYKITGSSEDYIWQNSDIIENIDGDKSYDFATMATDFAGNTSQSNAISLFVEKDTTPIFMLDYKKNVSTNNSLYAKASDIVDIGFGADSSKYNLSTLKVSDLIIRVGGVELTDVEKNLFSSEKTGNGETWKLSLRNITGNGELLIEIPENKAIDMDGNGNVTTILEPKIIVDNITPGPNSISLNNNATDTISQTVLANISSTGARYMYLSNTTTAPTEFSDVWTEYTNSRYHALTNGYGTKTVYAWFKDEAGNISERVSDSINYKANTGAIQAEIFLDTLAPTTNAPEVLVSTNAIILCHQEDRFADGGYKSGIVKIEYGYRVSGSTAAYTWQESNLLRSVPTVNYYEFVTRATDAAGNSSVSETTVQYVDITDIHVDVIFDAQGGTVTPLVETYIDGESYENLPKAIDKGRKFVSWNTKADGTGTTVTNGMTLISSYAHTLYAQYINVIDMNETTITLSNTGYIYDGSPKEPTVTIEWEGQPLEKDTDYSISYSDNLNAGTATVTITGKGVYVGTVEKTFTIEKGTAIITPSETSIVVVEKNTATLTYTYVGDGNITVSNTDTSKATVSVNKDTKTITITGVENGNVTITISAAEGRNYKAASSTVNVTVQDANYKVGTTYYPTLESAVKGASNADTIQVQQNVPNDTSNPVVDKEITIDLKGFTVTKTINGITNNGTLTITDTSGAKKGKIQTTDATNNKIASLIINKGTLEIDNVTLINNGHLTSNWRTISCYANSELNVNGGTLKTTLTSGETTDYVSRTIGIYEEGAKVNITGGKVINEFTGGLAIESYGENADTSILVSGGEVRSEGTGSMGIRIGVNDLASATSLSVTGGKVFGELHGIIIHADCTGTIEISGGEVTANANNALKNESTKNSVLITGGTLSTNTYAGITNSTANLTIGTSSDAVNTTTPVIIGGSYALNAINGFNFYDGILKGKSGTIYGGTVAEKVKAKPDGYQVFFDTETIEGVKYETARLEIGWDISNPDSADNNVWAYLVEDEENAGMYKLIVRGTGEIKNFNAYGDVPWVDEKDNVSKLIIEDGITVIGDRTFTYLKKIKTIQIPSSVTRINQFAFASCSGVNSPIIIPALLTEIRNNPFFEVPTEQFIVEDGNSKYKADNGVLYNYVDKSLLAYPYGKIDEEYTVLAGTKMILIYAFSGSKVKTVHLPESLENIRPYAFDNSAITSIIIPKTVNKIAHYAFNNTKNLEKVYLESTELTLEQKNNFTNMKSNSKIYTSSKFIADKFVADTHYTAANTVVYYPPEVTVHPVDYTVICPNQATFAVEIAEGNPNDFAYQWQYRENPEAEWKNVTEAHGTTNNSGTTSVFTTVPATPEMEGYQYRATVSSSEYPNIEMTQDELANVLVSNEATLIRDYIDITTGTVFIDNAEYTGQETRPTVILTVEGVTLVKTIDFNVEYQNNVESGMGTAIITGAGNYKNTIVTRYLIYLTNTPTIDVTGLTTGAEVSNTATSGDDITPPSVVTENQTDTEGAWATSNEWSKTKDFTIKGFDNETQIVRIKFQDVENSTTGYSFEDMYGIMERDESGNPVLNIRDYKFTGDVIGYVTAAIYLQDDSGNETTKYLRIYNLDNTAPTIKNITNTEETLNIKAQVKDTGSGLQSFAITSANQTEEPTKVENTKLSISSLGEVNASNKSAINTWYTVDNTAETDSSATNAQNVTITFGKLNAGNYKFWVKDLLGNVSSVEFTLEKYEYYSILATVKAQDGKSGEALLNITQGQDNVRTIKLDYLGDLVDPYVKILLQKKIGVSSNGANKYETVENNVTILEVKPLQATQDIEASFGEGLEAGEYQLLFELYDKYDYRRATESLEFKVN